MSGILVPSNHGNGEWHLASTTYPTCEKSHTRYTTYEGPNFNLGRPLFTQSNAYNIS